MSRGPYGVVVRGSLVCILVICTSGLWTASVKEGIIYPMQMVGFFIHQLGIMGLLIFAVWGFLIWARTKTAGATPGLCLECRYNLTGNTSGICPECGTPIPKETQEKLATDPPKQ